MQPLVTICIPNFNKSPFIERTLKSVFNQTYGSIELIVIDDCSTDNSVEIIKKILAESPLKSTLLLNEVNKGVSYTAQRGVEAAQGKYFQVLSSDDILLPEKIAQQVSVLENAPDDTAFVYGPIKIIDEQDQFIDKDYFKEIGFEGNELPSGNIYDALLKLNFIPALTTLIRLSSINNVGGYDTSLRSEDWDMSLLLCRKYNALYVDQVLAHYRVERNSLMHSGASRAMVFSSFCSTLMKHAGQSKGRDKIIFENIKKFAAIIYSFGGSDAGYWLKKSLQHSFSFKNLLYFLANLSGIKYSSYKKMKSAK
jgi:alpha-1,3-rhamnosyltransferase